LQIAFQANTRRERERAREKATKNGASFVDALLLADGERERERERKKERERERERERPNNGASDGNSLLLAARELRTPRAAMRGILVLERVDEVVGVGIACGSSYLSWWRREI
jgi:hypothetical protein